MISLSDAEFGVSIKKPIRPGDIVSLPLTYTAWRTGDEAVGSFHGNRGVMPRFMLARGVGAVVECRNDLVIEEWRLAGETHPVRTYNMTNSFPEFPKLVGVEGEDLVLAIGVECSWYDACGAYAAPDVVGNRLRVHGVYMDLTPVELEDAAWPAFCSWITDFSRFRMNAIECLPASADIPKGVRSVFRHGRKYEMSRSYLLDVEVLDIGSGHREEAFVR